MRKNKTVKVNANWLLMVAEQLVIKAKEVEATLDPRFPGRRETVDSIKGIAIALAKVAEYEAIPDKRSTTARRAGLTGCAIIGDA